MIGKVQLTKLENGWFYHILYGNKHSGSGYVTSYTYDDVNNIFHAGDALEFKGITVLQYMK